MYLLHKKNKELFYEQIQIAQIQYYTIHIEPTSIFENTNQYKVIYKKFMAQNRMIFSEGIVFMLLLFLGILQLYRTLRKEIFLNVQQRNFLLTISHELKSPISSIKLCSETLIKRKLLPNQQDRMHNIIISDANRLHNLVENMLFAAQIERSDVHLQFENLVYSDLLTEITQKYRHQYEQQKFIVNIEPNILIHADKSAIISIILNILDNALKYSNVDNLNYIYLQVIDNKSVMTIKDEGEGIAIEEKKKIFDKFYRVGNENIRKSKGTGLGLYIVHYLVQKHFGTINVSNNGIKGSKFTVTLPLIHG